MRMETVKKVGTLGSFLTGLLIDVPDFVERVAITAIFLIILDTITGVWYAAKIKKIKSETLRTQFIAKTIQYSILIGIGGAASYVTNHWGWVTGLLFGICAIEIFSMIENAVKLEEVGVRFPPFMRKLLQAIGQFFASTSESMVQTVSNEGGNIHVRESGELVQKPVQSEQEGNGEGSTAGHRHLQTGTPHPD